MVHGRAIPMARRSIPGTAKQLSADERTRLIDSGAPYALRLDMSAAIARAGTLSWTEQGEGPDGETGIVAAHPQAWGDVILARKETPTSYHLSVVVDDALQGVTDVVRGQDLFHATSVHRLLQHLLGLPEPAYRHHRLIRDEAGHKLAKSTGSTGLRELARGGDDARRHAPGSSGSRRFPCARRQPCRDSRWSPWQAEAGRGLSSMASKSRDPRKKRAPKRRPAKTRAAARPARKARLRNPA